MGYVYLLHFSKKLAHAQHYLGYAETSVVSRLAKHRSGGGAKILAACMKRGIKFRLARTWEEVDRNFERSLKNKKNTKLLCPICKKQAQLLMQKRKLNRQKKRYSMATRSMKAKPEAISATVAASQDTRPTVARSGAVAASAL